MSWHINHKGKSVIQDVVDLLKKGNGKYFMIIWMDNHNFTIYNDDTVSVGVRTLLIKHKTLSNQTYVKLINTNRIKFIDLVQSANYTEESVEDAVDTE